MTVDFQGAEIHYSVVGKGEPTVLLHGFLESSKIWEEFLPEFSKYGQIITIDLPGHGSSGCIKEVHSMELMAEAVWEILKAIGVKKGNFIGHSMGGYVSLAFLEKHPNMVNSLMLLNSTPQADSISKRETRDRSVELAKKNKRAYINVAINNLLSSNNVKKFPTEVKELKNTATKFPINGITAALKGMKIRTDKTDVFKGFTGKKILVAGDEDGLVNVKELKQLADSCGCRFILFRGGHLSYIENKPEITNLCISSII